MTWKQELGKQIRDARKGAGMTQSKLAKSIGVSRQMVTRYESGNDPPSIEILALAARTLEATFSVRGILVTSSDERGRGPRPVAKQLVLPFMRSRTFRKAVVEITHRRGRILISASLPA